MRQNRKSHLAFPNFNKAVSIWHQRKRTAGVILPLGVSDCFDWSSDKDDTLGLAGHFHMT